MKTHVAAGEYPSDWEWVVETTYGIYTDRKWGFCRRDESKEAAIRFCEDWTTGPRWDIYRVYNNKTGEIITASGMR